MFNKYPHYFAIPDNFLGQMNLEGLSVSSLKAEPPKINDSCIAEGGLKEEDAMEGGELAIP